MKFENLYFKLGPLDIAAETARLWQIRLNSRTNMYTLLWP